MKRIGFSSKLYTLIYQYLSTVSYSILHNGSHYPLSPYLFILATKLLSRLIFKVETSKELHGIKSP